MPPPLEKYTNSGDEDSDPEAFIIPQDNPDLPIDASYVTVATMNNQINELQVCIFLMKCNPVYWSFRHYLSVVYIIIAHMHSHIPRLFLYLIQIVLDYLDP